MDEAAPQRIPLSTGLRASAKTIARWMLIVGYIQAAVGGMAAVFGTIALLAVISHLGMRDLGIVVSLAGWVIFFRQGLLIQAGAEHFKAAVDDDPSEAQERLMLGFSRLSQVFLYDCVAAVLVFLPVALKWVS